MKMCQFTENISSVRGGVSLSEQFLLSANFTFRAQFIKGRAARESLPVCGRAPRTPRAGGGRSARRESARSSAARSPRSRTPAARPYPPLPPALSSRRRRRRRLTAKI
jgi:hypothetical protein